ncbi:MAG TPA: DUF881 domain-containing protein [Fimbriimonas sp.]|nr:DUF881 domain-containing protein [Fimbriimonas sp.]
MNPFATRLQNQSWVLPVSAMCLVLGFMIALAWVTKENRSSRTPFLAAEQKDRVNLATVDIEAFQQLSTEVSKLRQEKTELEKALAKRGEDSSLLNKALQELKVFAATTKVIGPGVVVTLRDSPKAQSDIAANGGQFLPDTAIHDDDVMKVVNELFASGAEAISVNNHRVANPTTFRCVGPTILVNDMKIAPPIVIRAVGDPGTLYGGMTLPGGILSQIQATGGEASMVQIEKVKEQELPAFIGKTSTQFIKVPEDGKETDKK